MEYEWDEAKQAANLDKHDIDFAAIEGFIWRTAAIDSSPRGGEMRYMATGYIGPHLFQVVFTTRGERTRILSLRRASRKEIWEYEQG